MVASAGLMDAPIYFFRGYFGMPPRWFDRHDEPTNAVYTFSRALAQILANHPRRIAVAFDESLGSCFRNTIWPDYKANRALPDDSIRAQFHHCRRLCDILGVRHYGGHTFEADDYLASLSRRALRSAGEVVIYSKDKDLRQLLRKRVSIRAGVDEAAQGLTEFSTRWQFAPSLWPDYQALVGDSSDNVPGVRGVGERSARLLIARYGGLEAILASPARWATDGVTLARPRQIAASLEAQGERALTLREVLRLRDDIDLGAGPLQRCRADGPALERWLADTGLARPLGRLLRALV